MIQVKPNHQPWLFSTVYASMLVVNCNLLWNHIRTIYDNYRGPWFMGGDFNDIMSQEEMGG